MALKRALARIYGEKGISLTVSIDPGLKFQGEKQDFEEMTGNLIDNACKWAATTVKLSVQADENGRWLILIDDDGPGLTKAEREEALKRGIRLDETAPGTGLGLSIVSDIAEMNGGGLELSQSPLGGLRAVIQLRRA